MNSLNDVAVDSGRMRGVGFVNFELLAVPSFIVPWRVDEKAKTKRLKNLQQLLHLYRAFAVLEVGDEPDARPCDAGKLHLRDALAFAFRLYEQSDLDGSLLFCVFHVAQPFCFTER